MQVNTDVPKNENGMGLYRQQSAADMPTYIFLSEAYEIRVKDERSLAMRGECFFCVRHDSHGLQRSKTARHFALLCCGQSRRICAISV
ncbi:hypothetical protein [Olivibacter domesticus]|uniref:hypothetical protein n=1 Tax=Olivibacter domesticus TaxID=407022 RepID=UPI00138FED62